MTPRHRIAAAHNPGQRLRAAVLARLERDELSSTQLAQRLGMAMTTAQHCLRCLALAGEIECVGRDDSGKLWRVPAKGER